MIIKQDDGSIIHREVIDTPVTRDSITSKHAEITQKTADLQAELQRIEADLAQYDQLTTAPLPPTPPTPPVQ